jgi:glutamate--cysteine ligase
MHFQPLAFAGPCTPPGPHSLLTAAPNRFYAYGVIGRLASLAAAHEFRAVSAEPLAAAG